MTILLHTEDTESLRPLQGWLGGGGWRWFLSHESLHGPTQHFVVFYQFWPKSRTWFRATLTTTTTTTFRGYLGAE